MVVPTGIEPILPPYQGGVLPLNYGTMAGDCVLEPQQTILETVMLPLHQPPLWLPQYGYNLHQPIIYGY